MVIWVIKIFLYISPVYSCHLFLISLLLLGPYHFWFMSFIVPIFAWNVPLVSLIFLNRSIVFPVLLFSSISVDHFRRRSSQSLLFFGTLLSDGYIFPFLFCLSRFFFSQLFVRPPQTTILPFCISFSWGWSWSLTSIQCRESLSIVLQALCLSGLMPWIYLSLPLYNCKGFDLGHIWMV